MWFRKWWVSPQVKIPGGFVYGGSVINVIFDLDGTLIDSSEDILSSLVKSFYDVLGIKIDIGKEVIGPPICDIVRHIFDVNNLWDLEDFNEMTIRLICDWFRYNYDDSEMKLTKLMPGSIELINFLSCSEHKCNLFVATNKPKKPTDIILDNLDIRKYFKDVITPFGGSSKAVMIMELMEKHGMNKYDTFYIGDTIDDAISSNKCGIISLIVTNGYGKMEDVKLSEMPSRSSKVKDLFHVIHILGGKNCQESQ